jgi:hypothetical protein
LTRPQADDVFGRSDRDHVAARALDLAGHVVWRWLAATAHNGATMPTAVGGVTLIAPSSASIEDQGL